MTRKNRDNPANETTDQQPRPTETMTENNRFPDDNANDENTENTGAFPEIPEPTPEDFQNDNAYVERETYSLGKIGADDVQDGYTYIDPETMTHHKKVILVSYCICGGPVTEPDDTHRCVDCEKVCCARCRIRLRRRTRCPICAEKAYALNKSLYRTLLLLDEGVMSVTDLTTTEVNNDGVTVRIDRTVPALLQLDYLRIEEEDGRTTQDANNRFTLSDSDTLSNAGKEALTVGNHVYSDDPDIKQLQEQIPIMKVANQDYD